MSRTAPYGDVLSVADRALVASKGVSVELASERQAINFRMNFYAKRKLLGHSRYDQLSCLQEGRIVKLVRKDAALVEVKIL